jgi:syringate O-demethylase
MSHKNLEEVLQASGNIVSLLRNMQTGPNVYPGIPAEFTNWRDEQQAWQKTCVLFHQSYHMAELSVVGPDAQKLLGRLAVNSFENFPVNKAKQFVPCTYDGYVIGDVILFHQARQQFNLVGRIPALNWVQFHARTGGYDVRVELDERSAVRRDPFNRKHFRFQLQGPHAMQVLNKALGRAAPDLKFFNMCSLTIAGRNVSALRHGMAGQPGYEIYGPYADGEAVRDAIVTAGAEFGIREVGGRAYSSNTLESGWIPSPLPAIYSGDKMKPYREWLPAECYEARASIGGSFVSRKIEDYYLTPWDLGYGPIVKFDHDFIGREALEKIAKNPKRTKVTLALNSKDVDRVIASQLDKGKRGKFIEFPSAVYSMHPYDKVVVNGRTVGISTWIGYSSNERKMLTLAILNNQYARPGTIVTLIWGEEKGGTAKPTVERHVQMPIRAVVSPVPYVDVARTAYRK